MGTFPAFFLAACMVFRRPLMVILATLIMENRREWSGAGAEAIMARTITKFNPIQLIKWSVQLVSQVASTRLWLSSQATPISSAGQWSISQWRRSQATPTSSVGQWPISSVVNQLEWLTQVVNHLGQWARVRVNHKWSINRRT